MYLSDKNLAARLGVHRTTIWRWVQNGEFPEPVRFTTGCTRWPLAAVEEWEKRAVGAA